MRCVVLALLATFALGHPAKADMRAMTLQGHQYYFDIPADFVESTEYANDRSKTFKSPVADTAIVFSVLSRNLQQQMDLYDAKFQRDYLFDGRVGRAIGMSSLSSHHSLFASIFATSCSGACVIGIGMFGGPSNNPDKPFDFEQAKSLLDSYTNQLGKGGFGGN